MSFLKDFKEDLSQAVNELVDDKKVEATEAVENSEENVDTLGADFSLDLDEIGSMMNEDASASDDSIEEAVSDNEATEDIGTDNMDFGLEAELSVEANTEETLEDVQAEELTEETTYEEDDLPSDEVAEITKGTCITGNIESDGSVNLYGKIKGDIKCKGKLIVTGRITGTSQAREIFANNAKVEGDVHSSGTIKVGNGSVIVGNIYATSAVIGGAVRGDIDVHGPVIVDGTAVVQGNIKSRSVQINNGAVIEGFCSQCYADIDYKSLFEDTFSEV